MTDAMNGRDPASGDAVPAPDVAAIRHAMQQAGIPAALQVAQAQLTRHGQHPALLQPIGELLLLAGRDADALPWLEAAGKAHPGDIDVWNQRALALSRLQRYDDAHMAYLQAVELAPGLAPLFINLGSNLNKAARYREAESWLRKGLQLAPDSPELRTNLAISLIQQGRIDEAQVGVDALLRAGYHAAELLEAHALLLHHAGKYQEAESLLRQLLTQQPHSPTLQYQLAQAAGSLGRLDEQAALLRQVLAADPTRDDIQSSLIFILNYAQTSSAESLLAEARRYGAMLHAKHRAKGRSTYTKWRCDSQPARLRVGLVSGDFRNHPIGHFLESVVPVLAGSSIELVAYANQVAEDALTQRIKPHFAAWCDISNLDDAQAAQRIHDDGVHILVDVSGHTAKHRLPVFALKPAPIQASWLAYLGTTGVPEIDWVIADRHIAPEHAPSHFVEGIWRMRDSYVHLSQPHEAVALTGAPILSQGFITFGSFNNLAKMTDAVVAVWARVLHAVPGSKLFLKTPQLRDPAVVSQTQARYGAHGIAADRLILEGSSPRADLLAAYNRVDIALDPFPYTGGTTSLEALWMSVPVLTLRGERFMSRMGESLLMNAGLAGWIAEDTDHLLRLAVAHAADRDALAHLRAGGLRSQVLASPLMDSQRFARDVETTFQEMWASWSNK